MIVNGEGLIFDTVGLSTESVDAGVGSVGVRAEFTSPLVHGIRGVRG